MLIARSQLHVKNLLNTDNFTMNSNSILSISIAECCFLVFWSTKIQIWTKSDNLEIQVCGRLWRHLFHYCCHGNQLDTTRFCLTESRNEAYYMRQISCQSDVLCRKLKGGGVPIDPPLRCSRNYFFFEASRVKFIFRICFSNVCKLEILKHGRYHRSFFKK